MKIFKYFLFLIIFMMPIGELLRVDLGNNISLKPLDLIVLLTSCTYFASLIFKRKQLPKTILAKPLILFCAVALFSLLINLPSLTPDQLLTAFLYWLRFASYVGIYFLIISLEKNFIKKIPLLLIIDGILILLLGFMQYFLYPNLRNLYYLGWDEHNFRMFSVFLDPNFAGAFFVLYFLFTVGATLQCLKQKNTKQVVLLTVVSIFTVIAIFLTYSRSAILMLVAGCISYLILIGRKELLFVPVGVIAVIILLLSPGFNRENTNLFRAASSFARFETYINALEIIKRKPLFGVGFNAYRYTQQSYGFRNTQTQYPSHADAGVDNSFLFVTATTGIIGLGAYLYLWVSILKRAYYLYYKYASISALVVICSSVGLFVNSFFINSLFFPAIILWMWVLIGLMEEN